MTSNSRNNAVPRRLRRSDKVCAGAKTYHREQHTLPVSATGKGGKEREEGGGGPSSENRRRDCGDFIGKKGEGACEVWICRVGDTARSSRSRHACLIVHDSVDANRPFGLPLHVGE